MTDEAMKKKRDELAKQNAEETWHSERHELEEEEQNTFDFQVADFKRGFDAGELYNKQLLEEAQLMNEMITKEVESCRNFVEAKCQRCDENEARTLEAQADLTKCKEEFEQVIKHDVDKIEAQYSTQLAEALAEVEKLKEKFTAQVKVINAQQEIVNELTSENEKLKFDNKRITELEKANVDLATESHLTKAALKEGFEKYVYEEMECRGDEDCDHCVIVSTLSEEKECIEALKNELTCFTKLNAELTTENEKLKDQIKVFELRPEFTVNKQISKSLDKELSKSVRLEKQNAELTAEVERLKAEAKHFAKDFTIVHRTLLDQRNINDQAWEKNKSLTATLKLAEEALTKCLYEMSHDSVTQEIGFDDFHEAIGEGNKALATIKERMKS